MCKTRDIIQTHISVSDAPQHLPQPAPTLALIGGDARQRFLADYFIKAEYRVKAMGLGDALPQSIRVCHDIARVLEDSELVILPLPCTRDGIHIFTPLDSQVAIPFASLAEQLAHHPSAHVFGGRIPEAWRHQLDAMGCTVTDYYNREDVQIKNARITAEGALMTAMELTDTGILGTPTAVIGYGRIGQYLSRILISLGSSVTVYARRSASLAQAASDGCATRHISELSSLTAGFGVIFNTVPVRLIGKDILSVMPCHTLLVDLASPPFGIDPDAAGEATSRCGLGVIFAPSLPGRYAPKSAGEVIAQGILSALAEQAEGGE